MKKLLSSIVVIMAIIGLVGCGASANTSVSSESPPSSVTEYLETPTSEANDSSAEPASIVSSSAPKDTQSSERSDNQIVSETPASQAEPSSVAAESSVVTTDNETVEPRVLIAYFSRTGNTGTLATMIQDQTGGELFQITTSEDYSGDYNTVLDKAQEEQRSNARPALSSKVENLDNYEIIFIGYPIWWGDTPMTILTFLESHDFTGKTIIPFCTHGSSGAGSSYRSIQTAASGATVLDGLAVQGSQASDAANTVKTWVESIPLDTAG